MENWEINAVFNIKFSWKVSKFAAGTIGNDVFIGRYNPVSKITQCVANKNEKLGIYKKMDALKM